MGSLAAVNFNDTIGCLFLTGVFATTLWTISTIQVYNYYRTYSNDPWRLKIHVTLAWTLDTAYLIAVLRMAYDFFVTGFASIFTLAHLEKNTISLITILSAFTILTVQALIITRIWNLSKHNIVLTGVAVVLVLAQFSTTIAYFAAVEPLTRFTQLVSVDTISRANSATIAVADTAIAAILVYLLNKSRSGFKRTDSIINRLISYTVASGLLTGVDGLLSVVFSVALPDTYIFLIFDGIGSMLYVVSMMFLLNSRQKVRSDFATDRFTGASNLRTSVLRAQCNGVSEDVIHVSSTRLPSSSGGEQSDLDQSMVFASKEDAV